MAAVCTHVPAGVGRRMIALQRLASGGRADLLYVRIRPVCTDQVGVREAQSYSSFTMVQGRATAGVDWLRRGEASFPAQTTSSRRPASPTGRSEEACWRLQLPHFSRTLHRTEHTYIRSTAAVEGHGALGWVHPHRQWYVWPCSAVCLGLRRRIQHGPSIVSEEHGSGVLGAPGRGSHR